MKNVNNKLIWIIYRKTEKVNEFCFKKKKRTETILLLDLPHKKPVQVY